jgi:hypothetical protein
MGGLLHFVLGSPWQNKEWLGLDEKKGPAGPFSEKIKGTVAYFLPTISSLTVSFLRP